MPSDNSVMVDLSDSNNGRVVRIWNGSRMLLFSHAPHIDGPLDPVWLGRSVIEALGLDVSGDAQPSNAIESACPNCGAVHSRQPYGIGSGPELSCAGCEWCWGAEGQDLQPVQPVYPFDSGDVIVLGPQIFAAKDESILNWKGTNYVPAPETGPDEEALEPVWMTMSERKAVAWVVSQAWATGEEGWLDLAARFVPADPEPRAPE